MPDSYLIGWAAVTRLLAQGKSLSGREPNSCFLNLGANDGSPRFADVSAATGFHFPDDSRALGFVDWDFDGDLDIWMLNRSAPTLRFLKNNQSTTSQFISLHLTGTRSNRNAIGARATLTTTGPARTSNSQMRSLTAGGSYFSQSSSWLHFGLPKNHRISSLTISWPSGDSQKIEDVRPGNFYKITEGSLPVPWNPPNGRPAPQAGAIEAAPLTNAARLVIGNRPLFPPLLTTPPNESPRLVSLWSATCPSCHQELTSWTAHQDQFEKAGIEVVLLNLDHSDSQQELVQNKIDELKMTFPVQLLAPEEVGTMDAFQQALSAIHLPLITPTSFLLDSSNRVVALYRGPVSTEQIIQDLRLLSLSEEEQYNAAIPFPARWLKPPNGADPGKVALKMHDEGLTIQAIHYLESEIAAAQAGTAPHRSRPIHELYFSLGRLNYKLNRIEPAITALKAALKLNPDHLLSNKDLARILYDQDELTESLPFIKKAVSLEPNHSENRHLLIFAALRLSDYDLALRETRAGLALSPNDVGLLFSKGLTMQALGRWNSAIQVYEKAVRLDRNHSMARNNIAWILATADDPSIRNPQLALRLVTPLLKAPGSDHALFLRTAAATSAESGDFSTALDLATKALDLASPPLKRQLQADLKNYQKEEPLRSVSRASNSTRKE